jgi:hypothetical protein
MLDDTSPLANVVPVSRSAAVDTDFTGNTFHGDEFIGYTTIA